MSLPPRAAVVRWLPWALLFASVTAIAQPTTAEQCRRQHANSRAAQLQCARQAHTPPTASAPLLTPPLANMQLLFGFFDRRFPRFNGGKEHLGVDFAAVPGMPVAAVCDGTVIANNIREADIVTAVVVIEHECPQPLGAVYAYYGHVHSGLLPGEFVAAGGAVGAIRDWGTNSHLHLGLSTQLHEDNWGVLPRGVSLPSLIAEGWVNPLEYLGAFTPPRTTGGKVPGKTAVGKARQ